MIAVNDGKIVKLGRSRRLGRYLELQDSTGNVYTYAKLGSGPAVVSGPEAGQGDRGADRAAAREGARGAPERNTKPLPSRRRRRGAGAPAVV